MKCRVHICLCKVSRKNRKSNDAEGSKTAGKARLIINSEKQDPFQFVFNTLAARRFQLKSGMCLSNSITQPIAVQSCSSTQKTRQVFEYFGSVLREV